MMTVKAGAELKASLLKEPVVVKKGKNVRINLERGTMVISTMGISEEDGLAGSMIRVRNIASNRIIYAKVMDSETVRIEF
jgi:flagellar basal body P-ring formation protein FlgA